MNMTSQCLWCNERKGRRRCPALAGPICSLCCGENRLLRIDCLSSCSFLAHHEEFQRERQCRRYQEEWGRVNPSPDKDDKIHWACFHISYLLYQSGKEIERLTDDDAASAVEFLTTQASPIIIIERPPSRLGNLLWEKLSPALEAGEILRDDFITALSRIQKIIETMKNDKNRRAFLQGLTAFLDKVLPVTEEASSDLIFTPDEFKNPIP
ncbi:TPA: hypothetical protein DD712_01150 [Candidatus Acetothermia bacterium]|nr:hypothetical protein [Candidatus Acetothermia bacterium]